MNSINQKTATAQDAGSAAADDTLWDAVIVGTGMGGASIGYSLASQGYRVLFLEKGREAVSQGKGGNDPENPEERLAEGLWPDRITAEIDGGLSELYAPLGCGPGGSTLLFGAALERFERCDFEPVPGLEHPTGGWPISYDSMVPYYERAERLYRVQGTSDPLSTPVDLPEPPEASEQDRLFMRDFQSAGLNPYRLHVGIAYQPGCRECLGRVCPTTCKSTAGAICLAPSLQRHKARILTECEVTRLIASGNRITGVEFRRNGSAIVVRGRIVILAAGTYRSASILLQSANDDWPNGLGNRSGMLGRNLMFHGSEWIAVWPRQRGSVEGPRKTIGIRDFYSADGMRLGSMQSIGLSASYYNILHFLVSWFDTSWFRWLRPLRPFLRIPAFIASKVFGDATIFALIVEDFGEWQNRIVCDPDRPEHIRVHYRINEDLKQRIALARMKLRKRLAGFRMLVLRPNTTINFGHPTGTCRFGRNPESSVLDPNCRSHEIDNLYVVDGSFMPTCGATNPALTIAANALRVGDAIGQRLRSEEKKRAKQPTMV